MSNEPGFKVAQRNTCIDVIKGFLLTLVIAGHIMLSDPNAPSIRGFIYFFHMPLFIAISGYLSYKSLMNYDMPGAIRKSLVRMGLPYVIAFLIYSSLSALKSSDSYSLQNAALVFIYPYYHLWYVPAIIIYIVLSKSILSLSKSLPIFVGASLSASFYFGDFLHRDAMKDSLTYMGDKRFYYYWCFFCVGLLCYRYRELNLRRWVAIPLSLGIAVWLLYAAPSSRLFTWALYLISTIIMILAMFNAIESRPGFRSKFFERVGESSLPIYLWHVLPIVVSRALFQGVTYYVASIIGVTVVIACSIHLQRSKGILHRLFCGGSMMSSSSDSPR